VVDPAPAASRSPSTAKLAPQKLAEEGSAPVRSSVAAKIAATDGRQGAPALQTISIAINPTGTSTRRAADLHRTRQSSRDDPKRPEGLKSSLVGSDLSPRRPLPPIAFLRKERCMRSTAGRRQARDPRHVYGTKARPTSFTFPSSCSRARALSHCPHRQAALHRQGRLHHRLSMNSGATTPSGKRPQLLRPLSGPKGFSESPPFPWPTPTSVQGRAEPGVHVGAHLWGR